MTLIRTDHNAENPYVQLHKGALTDPELSFKAKGLWAYCFSRPNDWKFRVKHLAKVSKDKEDAIYSALDELIKYGYCIRTQENKNGKFQPLEYVLSEVKIKKCLPHRDFPDAGFPDTEKQEPVSQGSTNIYTKERDILKKESTKEPAAPPSTFFSFKRVKLGKEKYEKLIQDFGGAKIQEMLERLDEYADINPKRFKQYADHATVIRKWLRDDEKKASKSPENRTKEVQGWLQSHKEKEWIIQAVKKNFVEIGKNYINFKKFADGYINFSYKDAEMLIDHLIQKSK